MTNQYVRLPDLELVVTDNSLPLSVVEDLAQNYTVATASKVRVDLQWGGPAAGGIGWGGPEIAVLIVIGELLRRATSDAYNIAKDFGIKAYGHIRTRQGARLYTDGALALAVDSEDGSLRLIFCIPEGLSSDDVRERIDQLERHYERLLEEWADRVQDEEEAKLRGPDVRLCWDAERSEWVECEPPPPFAYDEPTAAPP